MTLAQLSPEADLTPEPDQQPPAADLAPRWHPATRIAFRLCFVYFGLYVLTTQMLQGMLTIPGLNLPGFGTIPPVRTMVLWMGRYVLGITHPISLQTTGSGDKTYDWVQAFSLLVIAVIVTAIWSLVARRRTNHERLYRWFRLFIRMALATTFVSYGFAKAIPQQMPTLTLTRLVEPFGHFSPMGVLWYSVGASPAYEIFIGLAELGAAVMLFVPRTAQIGAMLALMDSIGIFVMNMTYDVPVKLFAFHLVLLSLVLLAPNARRLFDLFLLHRARRLREEPPLGRSEGAHRRWAIAQGAFGIYILGLNAFGGMQGWKTYGGGAPKSPLFGIWDVDQMTIDGEVRPALLTDTTRWRRVIFQRPTVMTFQRMNDTFTGQLVAIDTTAKTITVTVRDTTAPKPVLSYQRPSKERLIIDGTLNGRLTHMELAFRDPDSYLVRSRGFHWISEIPFNR